MTRSTADVVRIVIADDHVPTRASIRRVLEGDGFKVCGEASTAEACVEEVRRTAPDLALVDIRMPGNGIRAVADIVSEMPNVKVVMLTVSRSDEDLFQCLLSGASGYLLKDTPPSRLPTILRSVLNGEHALPRALVSRVVEEFRRRGRAERRPRLGKHGASLSEQEWEVLEDLARGATTAEIARRLFIAPVTVRSHISSIVRKLGVRDRAAAVAVLKDIERGEA